MWRSNRASIGIWPTLLRGSRPLVLPGEIDGQHGTPGIEPLPLLGLRSGIDAQRGDYTQVGNSVQHALVRSPHQSRSWTHQIYLHPLAYPLLWNHRFPFLPRRLNTQYSTLTVALGTLYVPINSRGSIRDETPSRRVADKTKMIANRIEARVVRDTVTENGAPVEMTDDWYAQDKAGNTGTSASTSPTTTTAGSSGRS